MRADEDKVALILLHSLDDLLRRASLVHFTDALQPIRFRQGRPLLQNVLGALSDIRAYFGRCSDPPGGVLLGHIGGRRHSDHEEFKLIGFCHPYAQLQCLLGPQGAFDRNSDAREWSLRVRICHVRPFLCCRPQIWLQRIAYSAGTIDFLRSRQAKQPRGVCSDDFCHPFPRHPLDRGDRIDDPSEERRFSGAPLELAAIRPRPIGLDHETTQRDGIDEFLIALTITRLRRNLDVIPFFNNRPGHLG
jgi:hypothetical protein